MSNYLMTWENKQALALNSVMSVKETASSAQKDCIYYKQMQDL
jgi:uracil DNA glycosylase